MNIYIFICFSYPKSNYKSSKIERVRERGGKKLTRRFLDTQEEARARERESFFVPSSERKL